MPTYQPRPRFLRDFKSLTAEQVAAWEKALDRFIACLRSGCFEPQPACQARAGVSRRVGDDVGLLAQFVEMLLEDRAQNGVDVTDLVGVEVQDAHASAGAHRP